MRLPTRRLLCGAGLTLLIACSELRVADQSNPSGSGTGQADDDSGSEGASGSSGGDALVKPDGAPTDAAKNDSSPAPVCDGPCPPEVIIDNLVQATAITVDATNVYFAIESGNGTVYQCPKTGCNGAPIELGPGYATAIVVQANTVYWGDFSAGKLQSCAVGGCNKLPTAVVSNQSQIKGAVTDDVDLFWATGGTIRHCTRATCSTATAQDIATNQGFVLSLAAEQATVIWPSSNTIFMCPAGPCATPTPLGPGSHDVSIHSGKAYWVNGSTKNVVTCPLTGCNQSPLTIGSSNTPSHPVSDGVNVYWRDDFLDQIYRCPAGGCLPSPEIIATKQRGQPGGGIALDGDYVYWTTTKAVLRLHK